MAFDYWWSICRQPTICLTITFLTSFWVGDNIIHVGAGGEEENRDEASGGKWHMCVHVCVEIIEVCGITINNPPSIRVHKEEKGGEWQGGWSRVMRGQPLAQKKPRPIAIFKFLFPLLSTAWGNLRVSKPRQGAREDAFITWRRHWCSQEKKDEDPRRAKRERDGGKEDRSR